MRLSKFTPSLCAVEGGVFGGMYFYHNMFIACHCPTRHLAQVFITANCTAIACGDATHPAPEKGRAGLRGGRHVLWLWVGCLFGGVALFCFCTLARFARLVLFAAGLLACSALCCASAWFLLVTTRHPFWFVLVPAGGNCFALVRACFYPSRNSVSNPFAIYIYTHIMCM